MGKKQRFKKVKECVVKKDGSENLCSKPTEIRSRIAAPVTLREKMKKLWEEFRIKEEENAAIESLIDAQDFSVEGDDLPSTPYETEGEIMDYLADPEAEYVETEEETKEENDETVSD
jgi:hypothetical protein